MNNLEILEAKVEEAPHYFDFTKNDFLGDCQGMAKLNHDPFPDKSPNDVVRREIIARKLVLHVRLKGEIYDIRPGVAVCFEGRNFAVTRSRISLNDKNPTADIEGEVFLSQPEPLKVLARLREYFAQK